ncbi:type II toxin-antitoxin system VapC family toxin [Pseudonocardia asaccharolytica]|uniref:PIN domain-containing protein n=1 Tax=Pseudonocardia asaccharolytica DSM 44247 = NBRC 16224 TaxID=1123024 RepID=A0A511D1S0_9PSEU|nr:hypothetical protein [Pseudonocardia asaccharolytica]GEL18637.1 hypothetical protein PA7_24740 [Pseudonocardia asaccharolytica DSM 44247 = NBRC 16224]
MIGGRVLDASALAAFATGRPVYVRALVWAAVEENLVIAIPSAALGRAWALLAPEHHPALQVLLGLPITVIDELGPAAAQESGLLMAASGHDDIVAGQVAASARRRGWPAVTGDPGALRKLDGAVVIEELP